jgi:hypothetical protein
MSDHVLINEVIPTHTEEYYRELDKRKVSTTKGPPRDPETYRYLVGLDHLDDEDGLTYKVTWIDKVKGYIVAYRRLVTPRASDTREELVPIHIADILSTVQKGLCGDSRRGLATCHAQHSGTSVSAD